MDFKGPYQVLRAKLTDLLADLERVQSVRRGSAPPDPFRLKRTGAGQIALVGLTNSGRSALVAALTSVATESGDYPFTTQVPTPGMMEVRGVPLQLVDTPAALEGLARGEGAGRPLLQLFRLADALALTVDLARDPLPQMGLLLSELRAGSIWPHPGRLPIVVRPKGKGRVEIRSRSVPTKEAEGLIRRMLREAGVSAAQVWVLGRFGVEDIERQLEAGACRPSMIVGTKSDEPRAAEHFAQLRAAYPLYPAVDVNFLVEAHFPELREMLFGLLGLMPVFCAAEDGTPEGEPVPMRPGSTVADLAEAIDRRLAERLSGAKIWGPSAQFPGQVVGPMHTLVEEDVVLLRT